MAAFVFYSLQQWFSTGFRERQPWLRRWPVKYKTAAGIVEKHCATGPVVPGNIKVTIIILVILVTSQS